ncbi:uncharacterized protein EAE97_009690 [Botrytis byssoidea]|uniref:2EXR domain-containing protein n=1 Tax=Botrytis byssoidea TaxID=139641 RepID=A0A9P5I435_9HELO|nr:uncharacterized protein EAE97_009690 [Botrytis byssoidea]KAF7928848.1 hypothetical protein EAE97_009690 [Botrytis byssoidea]
MPQTPSSLSQFLVFWDLPIEIRLKIWTHLIPPPRIIQLATHPNRDNAPLISLTKPPILFSISHETRTLALSTYNFLPVPHMRIPVSRNEDTVYITLSQVRSHRESQDDNHIATVLSLVSYFPITSLGFAAVCWGRMCELLNLISILAGMPHLREVLKVIEYGRDFTGELGLLDIPEWRQDWRRMANQVEAHIRDQREKLSIVGNGMGDVKMRSIHEKFNSTETRRSLEISTVLGKTRDEMK